MIDFFDHLKDFKEELKLRKRLRRFSKDAATLFKEKKMVKVCWKDKTSASFRPAADVPVRRFEWTL